MRALMSFLGLTATVALGGCAFRPSGGLADDDVSDGGVTSDAGDEDELDATGEVDATAADARAVDARPGFDADECPPGYGWILGQSSRYRVIDDAPWLAVQALCKAHSIGLTHLAVLADDGERDGVGAALFFRGEFRRLWIGVWHDGTGPHTVTGEALYPLTNLAPAQAVTWVRELGTPFRNDPITTGFAALCECDGQASTP